MYFSFQLSKSVIPFLVLSSALYTLALKSDTIPSLEPTLLENIKDFNLKPSFDDEYKLFLEELDSGTAKQGVKSRQKRYVYLNTETNLDVGYLIVIPITIVLPPMTNLFNTWRRKRSLDSFDTNTTSEEQSPVLQQQVDRITSYYGLINIPEKACQLRATCELSAEPSNFFPLSDIILSKLRDSLRAPASQMDKSTSTKPSLFELFTQAADDGLSFGRKICDTKYSKTCKYSIDKLLNMSMIKLWNNIQSKLRLKFTDDEYTTRH